MKSHRQDTESISEQAAEWLCVLAEGGAAEQASFLEWLKKSPRHVEEFLFVSATWKQVGELGARQPVSVETILAELSNAGPGSNVVALERGALPTRADPSIPESRDVAAPMMPGMPGMPGIPGTPGMRGMLGTPGIPGTPGHGAQPTGARAMRASRGYAWAAGIVLFLGLTCVLSWWISGRASNYSTAVGEQRTVSLQDGSVLYLNTDSGARVQFSEHAREIQLLKGEALFVVAPDPARPFRVRTDDAVVQAIGTRFNVRRLAGDTRVSVIEGRVKLARDEAALAHEASPDTSLSAGEEATIADNGRIVKAASADVSNAIAWRERRLVFKAETLENVIAEINRYSARQFRIEDDAARSTRLTATLDADQPESLARFLQQYSDLAVETRDGGFVIRRR